MGRQDQEMIYETIVTAGSLYNELKAINTTYTAVHQERTLESKHSRMKATTDLPWWLPLSKLHAINTEFSEAKGRRNGGTEAYNVRPAFKISSCIIYAAFGFFAFRSTIWAFMAEMFCTWCCKCADLGCTYFLSTSSYSGASTTEYTPQRPDNS